MEQTELQECQRPFGPDDSCDCNPEFSVICSFIRQFGDKIDIDLNIERLKDGIENQESLDDDLIDIHVKLLKKLRRYFVRDQWEKALMRFAYEYSYEDGQEIEHLGYLKTRPSIKLQLLRRLLDAQFECDQKFKAAVNLHEANDLRNQPVGRDIKGNTYWHCADSEGNFRLYSDEPLDHKSWKLVCKTPEELNDFIDELDKIKDDREKGEPHRESYNPFPEIFPEYFEKPSSPKENQEEHKKTSNKTSKKGWHRGRSKKSSRSTILQRVDENDIKVENQNNSILQKLDENDIKVENQNSNHEAICNSNQTSNIHIQSKSPKENGSIESQVKQTLENLITKVVTSFDYIFRWNSNDNHDNISKIDEKDEAINKTRKTKIKREKVKPVELPRRSSSRIQLLQQKKIAEDIELSKKNTEIPTNDSRAKCSESKIEGPSSSANHVKSNKRSKKDEQRWRLKSKKKLSWDKDDSDLSSTSSLTDSNGESFVEELNCALNPEVTSDYDEFACEEEETNDVPLVLKRARTARQTIEAEENGDLNNCTIVEEDKPCGRCDKSNDPDWILLCDMCDDGYHTTCCTPPLMFVPDGDWFCSPCEHKMLMTKLKEILASINELIAAKERERQEKQKLRQKAIKKNQPKQVVNDVLPVKRNRNTIPDLSEPLALQALDELLGDSSNQELPNSYSERAIKRQKKKSKQVSVKRKRRRNIDDYDRELDWRSRKTYSRSDRSPTSSLTESEREDVGESSSDRSHKNNKLKTRRARACISYRFQEYDELIRSAIRADLSTPESVDDKEDEDQNCTYGRGKDMATIEALAYQQESGLIEQATNDGGDNNTLTVPSTTAKTRKKGRKLNDLDSESEIDNDSSDKSFQASSDSEDSKKASTKRRRRQNIDEDDDDDEFEFDRRSRRTYSRSDTSFESDREELGESSSDESHNDDKLKTRKARACVSYRFQDYDELIESAIRADSNTPVSDDIKEDEEETCNYGRGKDMATIEALAYQQENGLVEQATSNGGENNTLTSALSTGKTRKKGRKLNDLDLKSETENDTSDESFQASSESEEEEEEDEETDVTEIDSESDSSFDEIVASKLSRSKFPRSKFSHDSKIYKE